MIASVYSHRNASGWKDPRINNSVINQHNYQSISKNDVRFACIGLAQIVFLGVKIRVFGKHLIGGILGKLFYVYLYTTMW